MKFIRDLSNLALMEWINDPVEEHPIWQAIMVLMTAGHGRVEPWPITKGLVAEAYRRRLINKDTYEDMVE